MLAKKIAQDLIKCFDNGNKLLICGNGGSAAESQHFAAELVGKLIFKRKPLPAIALTTDTSILTAISNDFQFYYVFGRQVEALGKEGDILIGISTSGDSMNINVALNTAENMGMQAIEFPRRGKNTQKIQEYQLKLIHNI